MQVAAFLGLLIIIEVNYVITMWTLWKIYDRIAEESER